MNVINGEKASVKAIRKMNQENLLRAIIRKKEITRSCLASEIGVSLMTVKSIVDDLIEHRLLVETVCESETGLGRKPKILSFSPQIGIMVCVSLTAKDFFQYQIYNVHGEMLDERQVLVDEQRDYRENLLRLIEQIKIDAERTGRSLLALGILVPGAYYEDADTVNYDLISGLERLPLKRFFKEQFPASIVKVVHDVFAGAQAEYDAELSRDDSLFYFYVGDGVGGAYIGGDGTWLCGEHLLAGEVGQFMVWDGEKKAILEDCISTLRLLKIIRKQRRDISFFEALRLYDAGDENVCRIINKAANLAAESLYNTVWILNPGRIVISSPYARYSEIMLQACERLNQKFDALPIPMRVDVLSSKLESRGEMLGCYSLLLSNWIDSLMYEKNAAAGAR